MVEMKPSLSGLLGKIDGTAVDNGQFAQRRSDVKFNGHCLKQRPGQISQFNRPCGLINNLQNSQSLTALLKSHELRVMWLL